MSIVHLLMDEQGGLWEAVRIGDFYLGRRVIMDDAGITVGIYEPLPARQFVLL